MVYKDTNLMHSQHAALCCITCLMSHMCLLIYRHASMTLHGLCRHDMVCVNKHTPYHPHTTLQETFLRLFFTTAAELARQATNSGVAAAGVCDAVFSTSLI